MSNQVSLGLPVLKEKGEFAVELANQIDHHACQCATYGQVGPDQPDNQFNAQFLHVDLQQEEFFFGRQMLKGFFKARGLDIVHRFLATRLFDQFIDFAFVVANRFCTKLVRSQFPGFLVLDNRAGANPQQFGDIEPGKKFFTLLLSLSGPARAFLSLVFHGLPTVSYIMALI
jgi:hypothetical protein